MKINDTCEHGVSKAELCRQCGAAAASPAAPQEDVQQTWCDHCSADLNGVKHILCERCYREYAGPRTFDPEFNAAPTPSLPARDVARAAAEEWFAERVNVGTDAERLATAIAIDRLTATILQHLPAAAETVGEREDKENEDAN